jgi:multiple sugar transport system substrate-binding protein
MNQIKKISFLFILSLVLFGCNQNKSKITITVLGENAASLQAMGAMKGEYEKERPNINLSFKPNSFDDAFNKANQDFANGTGLYDIVLLYNFSLSSFVRNNYVYKLDELYAITNIPDSLRAFEKDIFSEAWKEVSYYQNPSTKEIEKIGYPFATNTMVLIYNKKLFSDVSQKEKYKKQFNRELEVPTTWEEYANIVKFFTQPENNLYGVCLHGAEAWVYGEFMNFLFSMGGKMMDKQYGWQGDKNTPILLNTPEALNALEFYLSLKPYNSGNFTNVDMFEQSRVMKEGRTALGMIWSDGIYPAFMTEKGFSKDFGFAPIPGNVSILTGGTYFVNRKTKNPQQVMEYIVYLMQYDNQVKLAKEGLCSPLRTVYDDKDVNKLPYSKAVKESLERGIYMMEAGPETNLITEVVSNYIQKAWLGEITAKEALTRMQSEIEAGRGSLYDKID